MKRLETCPDCGGRVAENSKVVRDETIAGVRFMVTLPAAKCPKCDATFVPAGALQTKELRIAEHLLRGAANGPAFKYARKALGWRAVDFAEMLQVDAATVSRWENKIPDRAAWLFLWSSVKLRLGGQSTVPVREEQLPTDAPVDLSIC